MAVDNVLSRINENYSRFSKGQKKLAAYIRSNPDSAVFMTAAKLGREVGISESTTVRFAAALGYKGFPDFKRLLKKR